MNLQGMCSSHPEQHLIEALSAVHVGKYNLKVSYFLLDSYPSYAQTMIQPQTLPLTEYTRTSVLGLHHQHAGSR